MVAKYVSISHQIVYYIMQCALGLHNNTMRSEVNNNSFSILCWWTFREYQPYSKNKHDLNSTWAKFCQLIASLTVVQPQLSLTKLKLEYLKFSF